MEKKDSIFAGMTPAPAQAPAPAARPAVSDQEVSALKRKIEALEKNMAAQLEEKISEAVKASIAAAPPPPPPAAPRPPEMSTQFLLTRIGELDRRLEEFTRSALVSSAQMKNIEESKISARREIEDLLKVVREQQKYSEMDRQIHDQLEKSWRRVEELEKKLMDFYGAVLTGQQKKEDIDGMLSRDLGGKIEALSARVQLHAQALEKKLLGHDASLLAAADLKKEVIAELGRAREGALTLGREQAAAFKSMLEEQVRGPASADAELLRKELSGHMTGMQAAVGELVKDRLELVRGSVTGELELFKKGLAEHLAGMRVAVEALVEDRLEQIQGSVAAELERSGRAAAAEQELFRKELAGYMAEMRNMMADAGRASRENLAATGAAAEAVSRNTADTAALLRENLKKTGEVLGHEGGEFLAELERRNNRHVEALNTKYAEALSNASVLGFISASSDASVKQMTGLEEALSELVKQADKDKLGSALGVSGMLVRKNFEAMELLLARIRRDAAGLARIQKEAADRLKGVPGKGNE